MKAMLILGFLSCAVARAAIADEPSAVYVDALLDGRLWPAVVLTGSDKGWTLPLAPPTEAHACVLDMRDVSPGPLGRTDRSERIDVRVTRVGALARSRYTPNHTYRMALHCGAMRSADMLVQLLPSAAEQRSWLDRPVAAIANR